MSRLFLEVPWDEPTFVQRVLIRLCGSIRQNVCLTAFESPMPLQEASAAADPQTIDEVISSIT
jgi:hypothetical protein